MFESLLGVKVVLYGAGKNGKRWLAALLNSNINPAYFVDSNPSTDFVISDENGGALFLVNMPNVLLNEDRQQLKIIITPLNPYRKEIEGQIRAMGLESCLISESVNQFECNICCNTFPTFLPFDTIKMDDALCPFCGSYVRHRVLWNFIENSLCRRSHGRIKLLHFAPEMSYFERFSNNTSIDYYPVDINPERPHIRDCVDITNMQYEDEAFDLIVCTHVIEHVPNEKRALSELKRVLSASGIAYINAPVFQYLCVTLENPEYTPEERAQHYGQSDHVRKYGRDYPERLRAAGFNVDVLDNKSMTKENALKYGIPKSYRIYQCTRNDK